MIVAVVAVVVVAVVAEALNWNLTVQRSAVNWCWH